jgi:ATP-binding cassette subfamily B protein
VYLFDDSFSALDYSTDAALREALARDTADATVVIVAQRVSTIRSADRIVVLEGGRVVGVGTHRELMEENQTYREIVLSQLTEQEAA